MTDYPNKCPFCGVPYRVYSADEGTQSPDSHYHALRAENMDLSENQCVIDGGRLEDHDGTPYCTQQKEIAHQMARSEKLEAENARLRAVLKEANWWFYPPNPTGIEAVDRDRENRYRAFVERYEKALKGGK